MTLKLALDLAIALTGGAVAAWMVLRHVRARRELAAELQAERARFGNLAAQPPTRATGADAATGQLGLGTPQLAAHRGHPVVGHPPLGNAALWMRSAATGTLASSGANDTAPPVPAPLVRALASVEPVLANDLFPTDVDGTDGVQRVQAAPAPDAASCVATGDAGMEDVTTARDARAAAARATEQLVHLQQATAALGAALTVDAIADLVIGPVAAVVDADAAALAVVDPRSGAVGLVRVAGHPVGVSASLAGTTLPLEERTPIADVARSGHVIYLDTPVDWTAHYPALAAEEAARGRQAAAVLPCIAAGEVLGVVALRFGRSGALLDGDRALCETVAAQCAQALYRARLLDAQEQDRAAAQAGARQIAQIQRLTERVSVALTTADVMRVVGEDVAGAVAGASAAVYAARPTDARLELVSEFGDQQTCDTDEFAPDGIQFEAAALAAEAVATERLLVRDTPSARAGDPAATCIALPLGAGPSIVGALVLELRPPRALTSTEQDLLLAAGRIAAQGITRARLQSLREEERRRLARELHDEFGQTLTGLKFDLAYLAQQLDRDGGAEFAPEVRAMAGRVDRAVEALRRIAAELRPGVLDDLGLATALEWQAGELARRTGVACTLEIEVEDEVREPAATAVFRIFQEALTNVARHARASRVHAWLTHDGGLLRLRVVDDGVGMPADGSVRSGAMGLVGMRERAAALGGTLTVRATHPGGTEILLELPYAPHPARAAAFEAVAARELSEARVFAPEYPPARPDTVLEATPQTPPQTPQQTSRSAANTSAEP